MRYTDVRPVSDGGTPGDLKEFFATAFQSGFWLASIVRRSPVWTISDGEAKELGDQLHKCYRTLPVASKTWMGKRLDHIAPWAGLAVAVGGTVYGKVQEEKSARGALVQARQQQQQRSAPPANGARPAAPASPASGPAPGGGGGGNTPVYAVRPHPVDERGGNTSPIPGTDPLLDAVFDDSVSANG